MSWTRRAFTAAMVASQVALAAAFALPAAAQAPKTLTIAQGFDPQTLWPNGTTASDNLNAGNAIVEALLWSNPADGKIEPMLAEKWERTGPTIMKLSLRPNVKFTNGEPMNAAGFDKEFSHAPAGGLNKTNK